jgi:transposase
MLDVMAPRDARSLDHGTLEEMRFIAVRAVLDGETQRSVAKRLQVSFQTVCRWMKQYREQGEAGIVSTKAEGPTKKLNERQVGKLRRIIVGKNPRQLNFGTALWTLPIVTDLIQKLFDKILHATTVSRYLHEMGLTPQKPVRIAFQRDDNECRSWMEEEFPAIVREAKRKQAVLLFADETGVSEDHTVARTWGERGKTPTVRVSGARRRTNVISAVSPRGRCWFRCYGGTLNAGRYVEFLMDLLRDIRGPIVLIHDRHPAHKAAIVKRFIHEHADRLTVHELPPYAPHLNPDEHVWSYLKGRFKSCPVMEGDNFYERVEATMNDIAHDKPLVRSFFDHPEVKYVKAALGW